MLIQMINCAIEIASHSISTFVDSLLIKCVSDWRGLAFGLWCETQFQIYECRQPLAGVQSILPLFPSMNIVRNFGPPIFFGEIIDLSMFTSRVRRGNTLYSCHLLYSID